jgi:hypothetical protein
LIEESQKWLPAARRYAYFLGKEKGKWKEKAREKQIWNKKIAGKEESKEEEILKPESEPVK